VKLNLQRLAALEAAVGLKPRTDLDGRLAELVDQVQRSSVLLIRANFPGCARCVVRIERPPHAAHLCGLCTNVFRTKGIFGPDEPMKFQPFLGEPLELETEAEWSVGSPAGGSPPAAGV
jgi:hypothetical protein